MDAVVTKACSTCGCEKSLAMFYRCAPKPDGYHSQCKSCSAASRKKWYKGSTEIEKQRVRQWKAENPDTILAHDLRRRYGVSLEAYKALLTDQANRCAICKTGFNESIRPHVDHDHRTGKVRGLLCMSCNLGLGKFGDCPERLAAAITYLAR